MIQLVFPVLNFLRAMPPVDPLANRSQISYWKHEIRNWKFLFPRGIGNIKPKLMFIFGKRRPNPQSIPSVAIHSKAHLAKFPSSDPLAFFAALVGVPNVCNKVQFFFSQISACFFGQEEGEIAL